MAKRLPNRAKVLASSARVSTHSVDGPHVLSRPKRDSIGMKLANLLRPKRGKTGMAAASNSNAASGFGVQNGTTGYGSSPGMSGGPTSG